MGVTELKIFIVLANIILLVFIAGIIVFVIRYGRKKLQYEKEKALINERHMQEMLNTKLEIQQQTMADIGREIHDHIGQHLTLASIYAHQVSYENKMSPQSERISEIGKIIDESLADLRSLSKSLTNHSADIAELNALVSQECSRVNALNLFKISLAFQEQSFRISSTVKNFILRIIQEFLQNSLKHADCKNVSISFKYDRDGLRVHITDDGKGFNFSNYNSGETGGIGIANMRKRAELIGAGFSFDSKPGTGTMLELMIPENKLNFA